MSKKFLVASVAPLVLAAIAGAAGAQTAPAAPSSAALASNTSTQLGEVIVTAQRRSENLQKAAISVDAVSGADLVKNSISDTTTLGTQVPGLIVPAFGGGTVAYFIRGVGNFSENPFNDPAVAYNLDDVYIGLPVAAAEPFYDLRRVEVLKGPQGTLYGRNATGGAINIIPERPHLDDFGGYLTASYGNYNAYDVQGAVNIPIGHESALRVSGDILGHGAYLDDGTSDEDTKSVRVQFLTHPTEALTVRLSADYADIGGVGLGGTPLGAYAFDFATGHYVFESSGLTPPAGTYSPAGQAFMQTLSGQPAGRNLGPLTAYPFTNNKLWGLRGQIDYDTSAGVFTLITAWRPTSVDFGYGSIATAAQVKEHDDQYSVELRFAGARVGIFDYTLGAMYFRQTERGDFVIDQQPIDVFQSYDTSTNSYAAFGRLTAHVTDRLRLVGGARYTVDDKDFDGVSEALTIVCLNNTPYGPSCPSAPLFPFSMTPQGQPLPVPPVSGGAIPLFGPGGPPPYGIISRTDTVVDGSLTDRAPTFRGAVEYDLAPQSLLYASVETGYRSGGFSLASGFETYKPEYITAYTLGSKNRFFDNRLELNLELFLWKYRDQQINHLGYDALGDENNITQNVGRSTNEGAELEGRYLVTPHTVLTGNFQYLHTDYSQFSYLSPVLGGLPPNTGCAIAPATGGQDLVNCSGKPAFNAPRYTLNLGGEQTFPIADYDLVLSVDTQFLSSRYLGFDYLPQQLAPPVWRTDAQLSFGPHSSKWALALFVDNIENNRYPVNLPRFPIGNFVVETSAPPRLYGVRLNVSF